MDRKAYKMIAELRYQLPPIKETPIGQKFHINEIVRIIDIQGHPCRIGREGKTARIQYSYSQKYSGDDVKSYSLEHLWEKNSSAWWDEEQLELVKGIDEINDEIDLIEYERLKVKYKTNAMGTISNPTFDNKERRRYYGLRVGDTVRVKDPGGRTWGTREVLELCAGDNNRVVITSEKGNPIEWVAEWCEIITKIEDK
jgi:hypothetical protein